MTLDVAGVVGEFELVRSPADRLIAVLVGFRAGHGWFDVNRQYRCTRAHALYRVAVLVIPNAYVYNLVGLIIFEMLSFTNNVHCTVPQNFKLRPMR